MEAMRALQLRALRQLLQQTRSPVGSGSRGQAQKQMRNHNRDYHTVLQQQPRPQQRHGTLQRHATLASSTKSSAPTRSFATRTATRTTTRTMSSLTRRGTNLMRTMIRRRPQSTTSSTASSAAAATNEAALSLSQRLKKLSREYGWSALGVYLAFSALDFPFCFLAVRLIGADRIGYAEHVVMSWIKDVVKWPLPQEASADGASEEQPGEQQQEVLMPRDTGRVPVEDVTGEPKRVLEEGETIKIEDHGYNEAEKANRGANASLYTQLALAYAIHKSFIFIRVPLTAAVTPKVVKTLRSWGWNIGKRPAKKGVAASSTSGASGTAGVNTKGTGVKPDK